MAVAAQADERHAERTRAALRLEAAVEAAARRGETVSTVYLSPDDHAALGPDGCVVDTVTFRYGRVKVRPRKMLAPGVVRLVTTQQARDRRRVDGIRHEEV